MAFVDRRAQRFPTLEVRTSGKGPRIVLTSHGGAGIRAIIDVGRMSVRAIEDALEANGVWPVGQRHNRGDGEL